MDEWIEWKGGECPVAPDEKVKIRWCGGEEDGPYTAKNVYGWMA